METYADIGWTVEDVQSLRPGLTDTQAKEFLERNQRRIMDRLCELGWQVLEINLDLDDELPERPADEEE